MKNKMTSPIIVILTVIFTAVIAIGVSGCFFDRKTYELNLPNLENLKSISINVDTKNLVIENNDEIGNVLKLLNGNGRTTKNESVHDIPRNADKIITVFFNFLETETSAVLFVYQKNSNYYIEKPYNGIYKISADDYKEIEGIIG